MSWLGWSLLFILGGIGVDRWWSLVVGITGLLIWVSWLGLKGELRMKKLVKYGGLVGLGVVLSGVWTGGGKEWRWWVSMWVSGVLVGVVSGSEKKLGLVKGVLVAGAVLSLVAWVKGDEIGSLSLVSWATRQHHHLADWWGISLLGVGEVGWWGWLLGLVGGWWLVVGKSRAGLVSLLVGLGWLGKRINKVWLGLMVLGIVGVVVWIGREKALLVHRVYWWEGMRAVMVKPMGWGWGNFIEASDEYRVNLASCGSCVSSYAHNFWLEMGVAGGWLILGLVIWWWGMIGRQLPKGVVGAMMLAIMINFLTDYTYMIPAMWWLFWGLVGRMEE